MARKSSQPRTKGGRFAPKGTVRRRRAKAPTAAPEPRLSILSALPWTWQLAIGAGALVILLAVAGGLYAKGHADGDAGGYSRAQAYYTKVMADQAAANKSAIDAANKQLIETADQLAKTDAAYDDALTKIDAGSGGAGGDTGGLDQRRVNDLNSIK